MSNFLTRSLMVRTLAPIGVLLSLAIIFSVVETSYITNRDAHRALETRAHLSVTMLSGGASTVLWDIDRSGRIFYGFWPNFRMFRPFH